MRPHSVSFIVLAFRSDSLQLAELFAAFSEGTRIAGLVGQMILVSNDEQYPDGIDSGIEIVYGHGNVGFAKGVNLGVREVTSDYVVISNPDISVTPQAVSIFLAKLTKQRGVLVPVLCDQYGAVAYQSYEDWVYVIGRQISKVVSRRFLINASAEILPRWVKACGAFLGMPTSVARTYGPFDEAFFMYGEDRDLTRRLRRGGVPIHLERRVEVHHERGGSGVGLEGPLMFCKADSGLRIAYRRYGSIGRMVKSVDLLLEALSRSGTERQLALHAWRAADRLWRSQRGEPKSIDSTTVFSVRPLGRT